MELSWHIFHEIMVGRKSFFFKVEVTYEWLSAIYTHCKNIEHGVAKVDRENIEKLDKCMKPKRKKYTSK